MPQGHCKINLMNSLEQNYRQRLLLLPVSPSLFSTLFSSSSPIQIKKSQQVFSLSPFPPPHLSKLMQKEEITNLKIPLLSAQTSWPSCFLDPEILGTFNLLLTYACGYAFIKKREKKRTLSPPRHDLSSPTIAAP